MTSAARSEVIPGNESRLLKLAELDSLALTWP